jgi:hypothetical protein
MLCEPETSDDVVSAVAPAVRFIVPMILAPSRNDTVPFGVP